MLNLFPDFQHVSYIVGGAAKAFTLNDKDHGDLRECNKMTAVNLRLSLLPSRVPIEVTEVLNETCWQGPPALIVEIEKKWKCAYIVKFFPRGNQRLKPESPQSSKRVARKRHNL